MYLRQLSAIHLIAFVMFFSACAAGSQDYRPGRDIRADLTKSSRAKFILEVGQRGFIKIDNNEFSFELLRMNSGSNVTIELLDTGTKLDLPGQISKPVQPEAFDQPIVFELSTVIREAAIIYVSKRPREPQVETMPDDDMIVKKIHITVTILEDTTVHLALDDDAIKEMTLPKGTQASWEADRFAEVVILEADRAVLEVNRTIYKSAAEGKGLHLVVKTQDGRLVVENR